MAVTTKCITAKKSSQNLNAQTAMKKGFSNTAMIALPRHRMDTIYLDWWTGLNRNGSHWTGLTVSTAILQLLESGCLPSYNFSQSCSLLHDCTARYRTIISHVYIMRLSVRTYACRQLCTLQPCSILIH